MEYGFKIRAEFAHVKLITKALDILKSVSKGELTRCVSLLEENKKTYLETKLASLFIDCCGVWSVLGKWIGRRKKHRKGNFGQSYNTFFAICFVNHKSVFFLSKQD